LFGTRTERQTIKKWLAEHGRDEPVHYKQIASALGRDPASVSASLSIERKQAQVDDRPPYFVRVGPGLYRYNDLCEGAVDEDSILEVRHRADEFNKVTRSEMNQVIASLDLETFEKLGEVILLNCRARVEEIVTDRRYNGTVVMITSWRDDGGRSPVVVYVKKCDLDEEIEVDTILEIRGSLPRLGANQGVLISNGIVNAEARREALGYAPDGMKVSVPPVHLMDKEIILNILFESRTGIRSRNVEVFLLDNDFFDRLKS
jgi:hypothetical protein